MSIRDRLEDARILSGADRQQGAFIQVLIAAAATSRKRYPRDEWDDNESFRDFIYDEMGVITGGPKYAVVFPFQKQQTPLEDILYYHLRCQMLHEGAMPKSIVFTNPLIEDEKTHNVLHLGTPLGFPVGWIERVATAVWLAPENDDLWQDELERREEARDKLGDLKHDASFCRRPGQRSKEMKNDMARKSVGENKDDHIEDSLREVISKSQDYSSEDVVAQALFFLLVRVYNTWRTIRTLQTNTEDNEGYAIDAGTLLRAAFDAYLQAEYIFVDKAQQLSRANDYFDFAHIERYKYQTRVLSFDNWLSDHMKASPLREQGEKRVQDSYVRVKGRFLTTTRKKGATKQRVRNHWFPKTLADIARELGKKDEYELLLSSFNGCVHSSAAALTSGPHVASEHLLGWASTIVARIARLNVQHNKIELTEPHKDILDKLSKPYF